MSFSPSSSSSSSLSSIASSELSDLFGPSEEDSQGLPTYSDFLESIQYVDPGSLSPGSVCPICQEPYPQGQSERQSQESRKRPRLSESPHEATLALLHVLPFSESTIIPDLDLPVRLPCAFGHVVGDACIRQWLKPTTKSNAEGGAKTCPMDREPLFRTTSSLGVLDTRRRFDNGRSEIESIPLRPLIQGSVIDWDDEDAELTINARHMTSRLAELMWRVALRLEGPRELLEHSRLLSNPVSIRKFMRVGEEVRSFQAAVLKLCRDTPLKRDGRYPAFLQFLLQDEVAHMYCLLHRMARCKQGKTDHPTTFYMLFLTRLGEYFEAVLPYGVDLKNGFVDLDEHSRGWPNALVKLRERANGDRGHRLLIFANNVIAAWVSQAYLMTQLRDETGTMDEIVEFEDDLYHHLNWDMAELGYEEIDMQGNLGLYRRVVSDRLAGNTDEEGDTQMMDVEILSSESDGEEDT